MYKSIKIRRGLDLPIAGAVKPGTPLSTIGACSVAITPDDFPGLTPKVLVKAGQSVKAGEQIIVDKSDNRIALVSPIDGVVAEVVRGARRKVVRVEITPAETASEQTSTPIDAQSTGDIKSAMMQAGVWALMRQLPYDIVPLADAEPVNIFVTAFDSAPLAPNLTDSVADNSAWVAKGIEILARLTTGKVYIGLRKADLGADFYNEAANACSNVELVVVDGPHPAGLASIQAANIAPVNKSQTVWLLDIETAMRIGSLFAQGTANWATTVAVSGPEVKDPYIASTVVGAKLDAIVKKDELATDHHLRVISGNVLVGTAEQLNEGFLRYPYRQITIMAEGDDVDEFMGWASLSPKKMSATRTFLPRMFGRLYKPDARLSGGRRAMIMSGVYESVMPMDIMPEHLLKAIISRNIDSMEALGIYEVTPADFALCEYVDPSKLELQKIVREGLDYLRKELN